MITYILLSLLVILLIITIILLVVNNNRFKEAKVKISTAEENIDILLKKKLELLIDINKSIKKKVKENELSSVEELKDNSLDNFELEKELAKYDKVMLELTNFNIDIKYDKKELALFDEFSDTSIECLATEKYYNDNVITYNKLINLFPSNIIAKMKHYKNKPSFVFEKEEIFEILKK